jgi:DNA-directed RNA polymerase specialized sigma24 family protein
VAALLGLSPGTVKRHLFRAVHRLRRAVGGTS